MTKIELQSQIQRKVQGLPADVLQELYDYLETILEKRKQQAEVKSSLQEWWNGIADFSDDFLTQRIQPPLDKSENLFE
ncbi:MAG: hypothetical protein BGO21_09110 [Dyadobacter sp. 50-39]|jgi:hypothetical protein|uniref:DUF2281 domain-containing protein n=1 Tax=Dyadobacter sp. 50-39 TaxID=1895756 RepID=UPI000968A027|nr:DUF2281 domain-containing protein [Dyadobacter sp. 50-39]OJV21033.1 MAG: hypothetical protein BGO21_09110 [Dyadobacter sp. 50-39]